MASSFITKRRDAYKNTYNDLVKWLTEHNVKLSKGNSMLNPFFLPSSKLDKLDIEDIKQNGIGVEFSDELNIPQWIKLMWFSLGEYEVYFDGMSNWRFMAFDEVLNNYEIKNIVNAGKRLGQTTMDTIDNYETYKSKITSEDKTNIIDFAFRYLSMGYTLTLAYDTKTKTFFHRIDGGGDGHARLGNLDVYSRFDLLASENHKSMSLEEMFEWLEENIKDTDY